MNAVPESEASQIVLDVARTLRDGFDRHYRIFRQAAARARQLFENAEWQPLQTLSRERIAFYDERVAECAQRLNDIYDASRIGDALWQRIKLHYIGLLIHHKQPECAETFFNSVFCRILHRSYFNNSFIFVRPVISTEYLEDDEPAARPTYRVYYPAREGLATTLERIIGNFQLRTPLQNLPRDIDCLLRAIEEQLGSFTAADNFQIHVLSALFVRNKAAYVIGRMINGETVVPFAVPLRHAEGGGLALDTILLERSELLILFSFSHSYFLVDMEVPSAYVRFLRTILPGKPEAEIYTALGLQKHGKALFYRDLLHHLRFSSDRFVDAPGIKGMVMVVFTLPSFPYVFKVIRDRFAPPKETTREQVQACYQIVKQHDRLGRMADTLEFSSAAFPLARFDAALLAELRESAPSVLEFEGDEVIIRHLYIERRMVPLNLVLQNGNDEEREHAVREYGDALKDLLAANIFPGDLLYKNFGVTRHGRVVFYDYDEIEYLTNCRIRSVPAPRDALDEIAAEPWYPVGPHDIFPETFRNFLLGDPRVEQIFMKYHADLFDPALWQSHQDHILKNETPDFFPYPRSIRFCIRYPEHFGSTPYQPRAASPRQANPNS